VLPVFTSNVARQVALAGKGELVVGADADLVALTPEGTLRHLWAMGRPMIQNGEPCSFGLFETP
jgi:beta-aspartyl-dipeptidase (metallo-type)